MRKKYSYPTCNLAFYEKRSFILNSDDDPFSEDIDWEESFWENYKE